MAALIKIRVLDACAGSDYVYGKGGTYDVPEDRAKDLIKGGLAIAVGPIKPENAASKAIVETRKTGKK